eukprot:7748293-Alexandrium_andersonii.AAC.1
MRSSLAGPCEPSSGAHVRSPCGALERRSAEPGAELTCRLSAEPGAERQGKAHAGLRCRARAE